MQLFSFALCGTVVPSKALEIHITCASSFFTDERSDDDALTSETEVIHVYLHLKQLRRLAEPKERPFSDYWINSDI